MSAKVSVGVPVTAGLEGPAENGGWGGEVGKLAATPPVHRALTLTPLGHAALSLPPLPAGYWLIAVCEVVA